MSMSLRDQLLAAGLANKRQGKEARDHVHQQQRQKGKTGAAESPAVAPAQAQKAERDRELNRRKQDKIEAKARRAQILQWVEQDKLPRIAGDETYSFVDGGKVRRVSVDASRRAEILRGDVVIVRAGGHYEQLPAAATTRIRERDANAVVTVSAADVKVDDSDPYKDYVVPDDLVW